MILIETTCEQRRRVPLYLIGSLCWVEPYFTFYGFRYVKVEGWRGDTLDDFDAWSTRLDETGKIETSNPLVNRLFLNAL